MLAKQCFICAYLLCAVHIWHYPKKTQTLAHSYTQSQLARFWFQCFRLYLLLLSFVCTRCCEQCLSPCSLGSLSVITQAQMMINCCWFSVYKHAKCYYVNWIELTKIWCFHFVYWKTSSLGWQQNSFVVEDKNTTPKPTIELLTQKKGVKEGDETQMPTPNNKEAKQ